MENKTYLTTDELSGPHQVRPKNNPGTSEGQRPS